MPSTRDADVSRRLPGQVVTAIALIFLALLAWRITNYVTDERADYDPALYAAAGYHLLHGETLYTDFWDHKQPGIYVLNALAMAAGGASFDSIRILEKVFAVLTGWLFAAVLWRAYGSAFVALAGAFFGLFHVFAGPAFPDGNMTEQYAIVFVLGGILSLLWMPGSADSSSRSRLLAGIAGMCFSLATHIKEPFVLSSLPWFAFLLWQVRDSRRSMLLHGAAFVAGALIPFLVMLAYLIYSQSFMDWVDVFIYGLRYSELQATDESLFQEIRGGFSAARENMLAVLVTGVMLFSFGVLSLGSRGFQRSLRWIPLFALLALGMAFFGANASGRAYRHYFIQMSPSFILLLSAGLAFLLHLLRKQEMPWPRVLLGGFVVLSLVLWDTLALQEFAAKLREPFHSRQPGPIARYIRERSEPDERIWAANGSIAWIYLESQRLSATRYYGMFDHHFLGTWKSTEQEKRDRLLRDLQEAKPPFVVLDLKYIPRDERVIDWIYDHYQRAPVLEEGGSVVLYERLDTEG